VSEEKAGNKVPRLVEGRTAAGYFVEAGAACAVFAPSASLMTLMPFIDSSTDRVSDSRASSGLWNPSEF